MWALLKSFLVSYYNYVTFFNVTVFNLYLFILQQQLAQLQKEKSEILKNLALYYFTFVDVMEFKVWEQSHSVDLSCSELDAA